MALNSRPLFISFSFASLIIGILGKVNLASICTDEIRSEKCALPLCRCSSQDIPGNLKSSFVPQLVLITFDDAVSLTNFEIYKELLFNRKNPDGEPITATFFVSHEYTNYPSIHELWRNGHEIALHSISHESDIFYWKNMNASMWRQEVVDQREQLSQYAHIPISEVKGFRAPFLQTGGDTMYEVFSQAGLKYDCSRPTMEYRKPGLWPYTNDYLSIQECEIEPCPVGSHPGFWTVPMISMVGENGHGCAMVDTCNPYPGTPDETFELLNRNFLDHYNGNRAPFGIFAHSAWISHSKARKSGYIKFLDYLSTIKDAHIVSVSRALKWVQNPTPTANLSKFEAFKVTVRANSCEANACHYPGQQTPSGYMMERYLHSCSKCPDKYPWIGNHLGRTSW